MRRKHDDEDLDTRRRPTGNAERPLTAATMQSQIENLQMVLGTLIVWMAQSANSPIRVDEAERLIRMLGKE